MENINEDGDENMRDINLKTDLCIVGGGLSGLCAAIAAARNGIKVVIIQDRPVLGGNASSEIRMWVCGAHGLNNKETGIIEEIELENYYRNQTLSYSIWDSVLIEKAMLEDNITLMLNCTCNDVMMQDNSIKQVKAWQMTTESFVTVEAKQFADCSGDGILASLTGAEYRRGRESRHEYDESIAPDKADHKTMGMSCLFQARELDRSVPFIKPEWAYTFETDEDLPFRGHLLPETNYWWIELGGDKDEINDTEKLREELQKIVFGVWDHIKNKGAHGADNWALDFVGCLPGKRESRRYVGDHIITQKDIQNGGKFKDIVAYGGWSMDDHFPEGFNYNKGYPTIFHEAPTPYGIPYRALYSKNIDNLYCAGRNISATHSAMSSTRVMATCSLMGQAVGTAAAIAIRNKLTPRGVYENKIEVLQQKLMQDDCYLPGLKQEYSNITSQAAYKVENEDVNILIDGYERPIGENDHGWYGDINQTIQIDFSNEESIKEIRIVFDSDLNRGMKGRQSPYHKNMPCYYPKDMDFAAPPKTLVKSFTIQTLVDQGQYVEIIHKVNNYQRLVKIPINIKTKSLRFIPTETWGEEQVHIFSLTVKN